jgi:PAS domain S-box-containing protein
MIPGQRTVLIIDDSAADRELYRRYLLRDKEHNYTILEAELGEEGLELWQHHQPDAVLLDYRLPDLDGLEWLAQVRISTQQHCLPVIVVTGQGNEAIAVQAMKAGAQDYLVKGEITPESLQLVVNGAIEAVKLRTQLQQRIEREQLVAQITQTIHQSLELDKILQTAVTAIRQFLQTDRVLIFRLDSQGWGTVTTESVGTEWTPLLSTRIHDPCFNESYIESFAQGLSTIKPDIHDGNLDPCHVELLAKLQVKANLVVPILQDNRLWGMLIAHHCAAPRQWQSLEVDLLKELATQVGLALQQAELYRQAQIELTEREHAQAALQQANEQLQQRVEERTAALLQTNLQLRQEIDGHRQTETQLSQQDAFLKSIYDGTEQAIFVVDVAVDGEFRYVGFNPVSERYAGATDAQIKGKTPEEAFGDALGSAIRQNYERCLQANRSIAYEEQLDFETDSIWTLTTLVPLRDKEGQIYRIIGTATDISDRKRAEVELQHQKQELTRSNEELQRFAYAASHDLQEPLRMITSYLELLERRYKGRLDAKADQFIAYAVDGATRMQTLINDLLSYSRVGMQEQQVEIVDCEEIVRNVLSNLKVTIAQSNAAITHDPLPSVKADATQLTRLFQNLIGNAIKFRRAEPLEIHVGVKCANSKWLFSVHDNGMGIDTLIFRPNFYNFSKIK